jgi:glycosyltransferase involved in cell wall biosynthesis
MRRKIALMVRSLTGGGMERTVTTLANGFAARGHDTAVLVGVAAGNMRCEIAANVRLVPLLASSYFAARLLLLRTDPRASFMLAPFLVGPSPRMIRHLSALVTHLREQHVDVLFSAGTQSNLVALWARRFPGVRTRIVISEHNTMSSVVEHAKRRFRRRYPALARRAYGSADAIVAVSDGVAEDLCRLTGLPRERVVTVRNPVVSGEMLHKAQAPVDHHWLADPTVPVVLAVARLHRQKDFPTLIRAFARVRAVRPARLVILGEGDERAKLESLVRSLGVRDDVDLPGYTDNPFAWMAKASVFVFSSAWEGMGNVLVEAMACGCPVVSTDCPSGPAEVLDEGAFGTLVPVGDDAAMADAIHRVLDTPVDAERLRARASLFDREAAIDRYLEVLLEGTT